jgi:hypothetical protein
MFGGFLIVVHCHVTITRTATKSLNIIESLRKGRNFKNVQQESHFSQLSLHVISHQISQAFI